jgi:hypothetical protein
MDMNTSSVAYNYAIAITLYKSSNMQNIKAEIIKLIINQMSLVEVKYTRIGWKEDEIFTEIKKIFFFDIMNEGGQIGQPLIKPKGSSNLKPVKNLLELTQNFIPNLNIRELMSIIKNFQRPDSSCFMFSIVIEYQILKKKKNNQNNLRDFQVKYPMLDINHIEKTIVLIESILGFDILEVNECYNNLNGELVTTGVGCKPLYMMMQEEFLDPATRKYSSPITICWLWHALIYGVPYQDVQKLPAQNYIKQMSVSYEKQTIDTDCIDKVFQYFPIFPVLSNREKKYIISKGVDPLVDKLYERPPWTPPICYMKPIEPLTFSLNLQKRHNKYFVSNLSGHTMIFILLARFFKNININVIILACIVFMTPYNHSIHEIFKAAQIVGANDNYNIKLSDLENLNKLLTEIDYTPLNIRQVEAEYNSIIGKIPNDSIYNPNYEKPLTSTGGKRKNKSKHKRVKKSKHKRMKKSFKLKKTKRKFK